MPTMEKTSSRSVSTPMITSSNCINSRCSHFHSSYSYSECIKPRIVPTTVSGDHDKQSVERLVDVQVAKAMERLYRVHAQSLSNLESLLLEELVPRLDATREDHDHLLKRMMWRLQMLHPMVVRFKAGLQQSSSNCKELSVELEEQSEHQNRDQSPQASQSLGSSLQPRLSSLLFCKSDSGGSKASLSQSPLTSQSTDPKSQTQQLTQAEAVKQDDDIQLIYQNYAFGSPPINDIDDSRVKHREECNVLFSGHSSKKYSIEQPSRVRAINRRLLETNLFFNKSSFSLYMNRFKYPPPWPFSQPRRSKSAITQKSLQPLSWEQE